MSEFSRLELVAFVEQEARPAEGVLITIDPALSEKILEVEFSNDDFIGWTKKQGLADRHEHPVTINLKTKSPRDTEDNPHGYITRATTYVTKDGTNIDLYLADRIEEFDRDSAGQDLAVRERLFNEAVNRSLVHEVEHYVETTTGSVLLDARAELVIQSVIDFALEAPLGQTKTDTEITDRTLEAYKEHTAADTYQLYLGQPHEIRAREASQSYPLEQGYMLWLSLKP